jgi:hypothetical protein
MARSCLSDSARATDIRFRTALENAAKDWDAFAVVMENRESFGGGLVESRAKRALKVILTRAAHAIRSRVTV